MILSHSRNLSKYVVVLDIVGLDVKHLLSSSTSASSDSKIPNISGLVQQEGEFGYLKPVFPSVTCTVQSSILTGKYPNEHGIISNGMFDRVNLQTLFWEQSTNLVQSEKIWDHIKQKNQSAKTALLFWQNSMYSNNDFVISPRPIHLENGQMDMWCYSKPVDYYERLAQKIGEFNLLNYWGPFASFNSSDWITKSVEYTIENNRPQLLFAYFPQIDYSAQKFGKSSPEVTNDLQKIDESVGKIINAVKSAGIYDETEFILISEYGFNDVNGAVPINRILREKGLLKVRTIKGKEYIDFEFSHAFAMVDHQIAHIYLNNEGKESKEKIKKFLADISGIETVCDLDEKRNLHIDHERSGELIVIAEKDKWFSYYWWFEENTDPSLSNPGTKESNADEGSDKAPTFTKTVDIHRKPGYDPLDLFFDPIKKSISTNTSLIKGSHGRPCNIETKEGLSAFVSSRKINKPGQTLDGLPLMDCLDIFGLLSSRF